MTHLWLVVRPSASSQPASSPGPLQFGRRTDGPLRSSGRRKRPRRNIKRLKKGVKIGWNNDFMIQLSNFNISPFQTGNRKHFCLHLSKKITAVRGLNIGYRNTMITSFKHETTFRDNPTMLHLFRKTWRNPYFSSAMLVETNKCGHCWEVLIQLYDNSWGYRPVCYILRTYQTCCTTWELPQTFSLSWNHKVAQCAPSEKRTID